MNVVGTLRQYSNRYLKDKAGPRHRVADGLVRDRFYRKIEGDFLEEYSIIFDGPYSICGDDDFFKTDLSHKYGVYIWTLEYQGNHYIEYIGETGISFYKRTKEHLIQIMGGNYRVLDSEDILRGICNIIWAGMWRKGTRDKMNDFLSIYPDIAPKIKSYLQRICIFAADISVDDSRIRRRIEGGIAYVLHSQHQDVRRFIAEDIRYVKRKPSESEIKVNIKSALNIIGLPQELIV